MIVAISSHFMFQLGDFGFALLDLSLEIILICLHLLDFLRSPNIPFGT